MTQREDLRRDPSEALSTDESPRGETESTVARIFGEMLGISSLPRMASLFDLGLDSLAVTVACARLEQATGVRVRFTQLFKTPTVAQLATWIDTRSGANGGPQTPDLPPADKSAELVAITPMQAQTVPMDIVPRFAWWFDGRVDEVALATAATDVHRRHQALYARYLYEPDLGLAEVPSDPGQARFQQLPEQEDDGTASDALWQALEQPLHIDQGEVWRCAIVRSRQSGRTLFGLAAHHAAFDGRALEILTAELSTAYSARTTGSAPRWPGRTASLAEMAADFRHQLAAQDAEAQRRYWLDELRDLPPCQLPGRNDISPQPSGPAADFSFTLSQKQLRPWDEYASAHGIPSSVGMVAVYVQSLIRAGAPRDLGLMVTIGNKAGAVIDGTITTRVGNILLRPNGPSRSGPHLLARIRDSYLEGMAARDVLLDMKQMADILGESGGLEDMFIGKPAVVYNSMPALSLGSNTGVMDSKMDEWSACVHAFLLEVLPISDGLEMHMVVRTDLYDASLSDQLGQHFAEIIENGPGQLELETAR
ncbi:condensation domain-containing protein [Micromonospora sp. NPDC049645]|uniref:condensation domain-containing protein n=1 Tax=Micromonospora sp. NPDC049645 TaxID=3155508 RepID=UPI003421189F